MNRIRALTLAAAGIAGLLGTQGPRGRKPLRRHRPLSSQGRQRGTVRRLRLCN